MERYNIFCIYVLRSVRDIELVWNVTYLSLKKIGLFISFHHAKEISNMKPKPSISCARKYLRCGETFSWYEADKVDSIFIYEYLWVPYLSRVRCKVVCNHLWLKWRQGHRKRAHFPSKEWGNPSPTYSYLNFISTARFPVSDTAVLNNGLVTIVTRTSQWSLAKRPTFLLCTPSTRNSCSFKGCNLWLK